MSLSNPTFINWVLVILAKLNNVFLDNHREYIEKAIKPIAKAKYRDKIKKKRNILREEKKTDLRTTTKTKRLPKISYYTTI
jgi:DNA-binding phage protein